MHFCLFIFVYFLLCNFIQFFNALFFCILLFYFGFYFFCGFFEFYFD
ncbi:hypothetical protein PAUR_a3755 [Pseudoalteromonas aurantia 208]|uniref:Uncharacterized protein n=1 Tax=Pseudoalteromonas aurantia 208 TaxID=1314867 RepID=A0ABR9E6S9_9GAMM|nr:hypothetical protein [Pseudoalteromonas aurantia 208]